MAGDVQFGENEGGYEASELRGSNRKRSSDDVVSCS